MKGKNAIKKVSGFKVNTGLLYCLVIILVLLLIGIGVAFSYAFWIKTETQTNQNEVTTGCLSFNFNDKDINNNVTSISLLNDYPKSDTKGLLSVPYVFTITNNCSLSGKFEIYLNTLADSNLSSQFVKIHMSNSDSSVIFNPTIVNKLDSVEINEDTFESIVSKIGSLSESYLLHTVTLDSNDSETFNLRLWIDEKAPNSIMGNTYYGAISVIELPIN